MEGMRLLAQANAAGLEVRADGDLLVIRGRRSLERLVQRLLARKQEVMAWLATDDAEVAWRAEAMRRQIPQHGPVPYLVARHVVAKENHCLSCGSRLSEGRIARCTACTQAVWLVLTEGSD